MRRRGVEARQQRAEAKAAAVESSRKGLNVLLGERLEAKADEMVTALESLAFSSDPSVALQGIKLWLERVYGRAVQPTADVTEERSPLVEAFAALTPEERRAMLALAPSLPERPHTASAEG